MYYERFRMWTTAEGCFVATDRAEDAPDRILSARHRQQDYVDRFYAKFERF